MQDERLRNELLAEVDSIAPILAEHAPLSEKLGRQDAPSIEALRSTRLVRMFAPRELGGLEADPVTAILVLEALARIDGSASWTIGILGSSALFAGPYLPAATARRIYAKGVPPMAGSFVPKGQAEPVAGGYRVKGRWPFASGIHHADWVMAGAFVPGQPNPAGSRLVVMPRDQVVIHDNWQVAGLRGTGSCDFSIESVFVPEEMTCPLMDVMLGKAITGGAAVRLGLPAGVASFHIGIPWELPVVPWTRSQRRRSRRAAAFRLLRCIPIRTFSSRSARQRWNSHRPARSHCNFYRSFTRRPKP
jgi:alkylation response protein AidB-like acyl-CoA dehydrogenase